MAITRLVIRSASGKTGNGNQWDLNALGITIQAGSAIVAVMAADSVTLSTSSCYYKKDSGSSNVAPDTTGSVSNAGNVVLSYAIWYNVGASGTGAILNIIGTPGSESYAHFSIELQGVETSAALDKTSTGTGTGTSPSSGATATISQADEILIGAIGQEGPLGDTRGTWSNSFNAGQRDGTTGGSAASNIVVDEGYLIVSSTGAYTAAQTSAPNRDWAALILTFKAAASASPINQAASDSNASNWNDDKVVAYGYAQKPADTLNNFSDNLANLFGYLLTKADQLTLSDSLSPQLNHFLTFNDAISQSDALLTTLLGLLTLNQSDTLNTPWSDAAASLYGYGVNASDSANNLTDALVNLLCYCIASSDQISLSDAHTKILESRINFSDSFSQSDSLATTFIGYYNQLAADFLSLDDSLATLLGVGLNISDSSNNLSDAILLNLAYLLQQTDQLVLTDALTAQLNHLLQLAENAANLADAVALSSNQPGLQVSVSDQITLNDAIQAQLTYLVALTDFLTQNDSLVQVLLTLLQLSDSFSQSDAVDKVLGFNKSAADQFSQSDAISQILGHVLNLSDVFSQSDNVSGLLQHFLALNETLSLNDELKVNLHHRLSLISDFLTFADSHNLNLTIGGDAALSASFADLLSFTDTLTTVLQVFVAGIFDLGDIVERIRQTLQNPVFWTTDDINMSVQDGYDEIIATTGSILKAAILPFSQDVIYYDFRELISDYVAIVAMFNTVTKRWMLPVSLRWLDAKNTDWELDKGTPEYFSVVSHRYVAINSRTPDPNYGNMYVFYKASAQALLEDNAIKFNNDFIMALEEYSVMDLLEQQQEFTKASMHFKSYLNLLAQLEVWVKNNRESGRIPSLR